MSIRKILLNLLLLLGAGLLASCAARHPYEPLSGGGKKQTSAYEKGMQSLLGRGVKQDNNEAFRLFSHAAEDGDALAQNELGYLYAVGVGTKRDSAKAFEWYEKAAKQDLASAQYDLGMLYLHGIGTPVNKELAIHWFKYSKSHGFEPAILALQRLAPSDTAPLLAAAAPSNAHAS